MNQNLELKSKGMKLEDEMLQQYFNKDVIVRMMDAGNENDYYLGNLTRNSENFIELSHAVQNSYDFKTTLEDYAAAKSKESNPRLIGKRNISSIAELTESERVY